MTEDEMVGWRHQLNQENFEGISFKPTLPVKNLHPERRKLSKPHALSSRSES